MKDILLFTVFVLSTVVSLTSEASEQCGEGHQICVGQTVLYSVPTSSISREFLVQIDSIIDQKTAQVTKLGTEESTVVGLSHLSSEVQCTSDSRKICRGDRDAYRPYLRVKKVFKNDWLMIENTKTKVTAFVGISGYIGDAAFGKAVSCNNEIEMCVGDLALMRNGRSVRIKSLSSDGRAVVTETSLFQESRDIYLSAGEAYLLRPF